MNSPHPHTGRVIVVGMDGSPRGEAALRWALEAGTHAGDVVRAILVRPRDTLLPGASLALQPHGRVPEGEYSLEDHVGGLGVDTAATVETRTIHGDPATELVTASANADLLVLGAPPRRRDGGPGAGRCRPRVRTFLPLPDRRHHPGGGAPPHTGLSRVPATSESLWRPPRGTGFPDGGLRRLSAFQARRPAQRKSSSAPHTSTGIGSISAITHAGSAAVPNIVCNSGR